MDIEEFAKITHSIIAKDGFDDFLPTLCIPERREISVLEGAPEDFNNIKEKSLIWSEDKTNPEEEYLLAIKTNENEFTIIKRQYNAMTEMVFIVKNA